MRDRPAGDGGADDRSAVGVADGLGVRVSRCAGVGAGEVSGAGGRPVRAGTAATGASPRAVPPTACCTPHQLTASPASVAVHHAVANRIRMAAIIAGRAR